MRYILLWCEDAARGGEQTAALLEGAKLAHLQQLAQAGAGGTIRQPEAATPLNRFALARSLVGLDPEDREASAGSCYAASANVHLAEGEIAWCCDLVTHQGGRILDPSAANIPTKESELLLHALDHELGSDTLRWEAGEGPHHLLVTSDPSFAGAGAANALQSVIEQASKILESHPVNRVRVDLGENPANLLWVWGGSDATPRATFRERTGFSGALVSNSFLLRGLARVLGLDWSAGPPSFSESAMQRFANTAAQATLKHDVTVLHLRIDTADPVERLCAMERIDHVLHTLTEAVSHEPWRLLVAIDDRHHHAIPFVAIGTGLPQQPIARLQASSFAESPLAFENNAGIFSWFTRRAA